MKILLKSFAGLPEIIGAREKEISLPEGASVGTLLRGLCRESPLLSEKLFDAAGGLKPYILVLKNGRNISSLRHLDTDLADGDEVALFPPVAGG